MALLERNAHRKLVLKAEQTGQRQDTPAGRGRVITQERRSQEDKRRHLTAKLLTVTLYFFARKKGTLPAKITVSGAWHVRCTLPVDSLKTLKDTVSAGIYFCNTLFF